VFLWDVVSGATIRKFRGHDNNTVNAVGGLHRRGWRWRWCCPKCRTLLAPQHPQGA
jgi:hypothetical protein